MKNAFFSCSGAVVIAALLSTQITFAGASSRFDLLKKDLRAVTAVEMPAKAAQLVSQAKPEAREATAQMVVVAANAIRPVALVAVVGAISRNTPDAAAAAAAKAAALRPKDAALFAGTAASAAPGRAVKIVHAVCKAAPSEYTTIFATVAQAVPDASREQLWTAVLAAVPSAKASATSGATPATLGTLPPPTVGPPFTPLPGSPTEINRTNTVPVPGYGGP